MMSMLCIHVQAYLWYQNIASVATVWLQAIGQAIMGNVNQTIVDRMA